MTETMKMMAGVSYDYGKYLLEQKLIICPSCSRSNGKAYAVIGNGKNACYACATDISQQINEAALNIADAFDKTNPNDTPITDDRDHDPTENELNNVGRGGMDKLEGELGQIADDNAMDAELQDLPGVDGDAGATDTPSVADVEDQMLAPADQPDATEAPTPSKADNIELALLQLVQTMLDKINTGELDDNADDGLVDDGLDVGADIGDDDQFAATDADEVTGSLEDDDQPQEDAGELEGSLEGDDQSQEGELTPTQGEENEELTSIDSVVKDEVATVDQSTDSDVNSLRSAMEHDNDPVWLKHKPGLTEIINNALTKSITQQDAEIMSDVVRILDALNVKGAVYQQVVNLQNKFRNPTEVTTGDDITQVAMKAERGNAPQYTEAACPNGDCGAKPVDVPMNYSLDFKSSVEDDGTRMLVPTAVTKDIQNAIAQFQDKTVELQELNELEKAVWCERMVGILSQIERNLGSNRDDYVKAGLIMQTLNSDAIRAIPQSVIKYLTAGGLQTESLASLMGWDD